MKKPTLLKLACLLMVLCAIPESMRATEIEATLNPVSVSPSKERPFAAPLEEVGFVFDRCIKFYDNHQTVTIKCGNEVVATAVSLEIENYEGEKSKQGTLIAKFDKQNLPKGKTYTICLSKGAVGWVECYSDIQIVNREYSYDVNIPDNLGIPETNHAEELPAIPESYEYVLCLYYNGFEVAPVGTPKFLLYREDELINEIPAEVSWDWNLGQVSPKFTEKINFEFGVRYKLVLPAGSVSALHREDIVNDEYSFHFVGAYKEPDAPFSYSWCSLFTNHSDVLNEVSFTYSSPVGVAEDAVIELYEGDCETLVKTAPAYLNTLVNCFMVSCDFGGFKMTSEKGYTLVVPDDAVYLQQFPDIKAKGGNVKIYGTSGIESITGKEDDAQPYYDLNGTVVNSPQKGRIYIHKGKKVIIL